MQAFYPVYGPLEVNAAMLSYSNNAVPLTVLWFTTLTAKSDFVNDLLWNVAMKTTEVTHAELGAPTCDKQVRN
jgi:hypothetical protein